MRIAMFGATRGCGLEALLLLLEQSQPQIEVHALVRNEESFRAVLKEQGVDTNKVKQLYITKGDALLSDQVKSFLRGVAERGHIDAVISSLGSLPVMSIWSPLKVKFPAGMENICGRTMTNILNALEEVASMQEDKKVPRLIVVSANGMAKSSHDVLPLLLKPLYGSFLEVPHEDKADMERLLHSRYNISSSDFVTRPSSEKKDIYDSAKLTILRPSLLTNGKAKGELRSSEDVLPGAWTISRKDVGAYIVRNCLAIGSQMSEKKVVSKTSTWKGGLVLSY